ncbi:Poly [ADP-ribose] polymerase tankyrase [Halotydeus destructor]|nr:Poly [ADP-ribose] polymerase tankyrase [Halotydeus destructor]
MGGLLARTSTNAKLIDGDEKFPKLHRAVCFGRLKKVKSLLEQGHDVNQCDEFGRTALHEAAFGGRFECAKVLLEAGAHVRIGGRLEGQPIYIAATKGFVDIVKLLLDHGDDINENDSRDCSLLDHAVRSSKPEVVALLLKRGACVRLETIKTAITRRSVDIAILLIEATDNHEDSIRTESNQGTLLDCAVEFSQREIVSLMLEQGAHIQLETIKTVIRKGFVEMAIRLIEAAEHQRDSINAVQYGESLLDCALEYDQPEVVDVLLKKEP